MLPPKTYNRERTILLPAAPQLTALPYSRKDSIVLMLQSAKENCFNQQGFYALKKLEHEHLILLAKVH